MKKLLGSSLFFVAFVAFPILVVAQSAGATIGIIHNLSFGSNGEEVSTLQQKLQELGYFPKTVQLTGYFGQVTKKAVQSFQKANSVWATGYVGPITRQALLRYFLGNKDTTSSPAVTGFIEGSVTLKFTNPCLTATIPCDPIITITIYQADGKTVAATASNWNTDRYKVELKPGQYIVFTQDGPSKDDIKVHQVTVVSGQTTKFDLVDPVGKWTQ